jgi:hypothetical protein
LVLGKQALKITEQGCNRARTDEIPLLHQLLYSDNLSAQKGFCGFVGVKGDISEKDKGSHYPL